MAAATGHADLLAALADPARPRLDARRVVVLVAHPDDETVGCGGVLARLTGVTVVVATDGAPRNLHDAHDHGFATVATYAAERAHELVTACALAGCPAAQIVRLGIPDQGAAFALVPLARRLAGLFAARQVATVLTHAYEGGHPDHDATCFAAHAAVRLLAANGPGPAIVEMPLYRMGDTGMELQSFGADAADVTRVVLTPEEQEHKRRMLDRYRTQAAILAPFGTEVELFRTAPVHQFAELPNGGRLLYEHFDWRLSGAQWRTLAAAAMADLSFGDGA